jgi:hypothetical protein
MVEEDGIGHTNAKCYVFGNYNLIYKRKKYWAYYIWKISCVYISICKRKILLSIQMPSVDAYTYDIDDYCVG